VIALRTLVGMLWFSSQFFVAFPALVLYLSGVDPLERLRTLGPTGVALLALVGAVLAVQVTHFVRTGAGTPVPLDPPHRLVICGPYRRCRNPMYLLYLLVILAEAAALRSGVLLLYAAGFAALVHTYVVRVEEPGLARRFGEAYDHYCRAVPRWLPRR